MRRNNPSTAKRQCDIFQSVERQKQMAGAESIAVQALPVAAAGVSNEDGSDRFTDC
jgi:hypothetical protein